MIGQLNGRPRSKPLVGKLPKEVSLERLVNAYLDDRKELEPFRERRKEAVEQLAGHNYGEGGTTGEVPVNLLGLYVQIMSRSLVANNPRVMYSTFIREQEMAVNAMQEWANEEIVRMNVVETYKRVVIDSLLCVGIMKIALATPADAMISGWDLKAGQPFMSAVDLDDFACDMTARRFDECQYHACMYRIPVAVANELYAKGREEFESSDWSQFNYGGDERIDTIGRSRGHREEFEDHCTLHEFYLARHKLIVTLRDNGGIPDWDKPVRIQPWIGPPGGPYHFLGMGIVPGNLMPKAPIMDLIDLHRHYNRAYNKLLRETRDYKKTYAYRGQNTDEAKRHKDAVDGEMYQSDDPTSIAPVESGGPSNAVLVMSDHMKANFDFIGGNLSLLGGRAPQSRTASQDKMLNDNASAGVDDMQDASQSFVQSTMESENWFWWHHPVKVMQSKWRSPSMPDMAITQRVHPAGANTKEPKRNGPMPKIKVDTYSLTRQTPQSRLAFINQVLQTVAPMMQLLQQQGVMLDGNALMDIFAKYGDEPDLAKIFHYSEPPAPDQSQQGGGQPPGMPSNTTRTYNRISTAGQGPQEKAADLTAKMGSMAGPVNPNQGG